MGPPFRHLIFDMDGTLVDSRAGIQGSIRHTLGRLGHVLPEATDLDPMIGPPLEEVMSRLLTPLGDDRTTLAVAYYREHYGAGGLFDAHVYEGIPKLLADLTASGRTLWVGTSKTTSFASRILDHFGLADPFSGIYGTDPGGPAPSKTQIFRRIVMEWRLPPAETVVIGDREHDIIAARANGLATVAVLYGFGSREELAAAGAEVFCKTPADLLDLL
ncbi:phosphoglycolate phosphatase [Singulisphaera sp. GP187]|uniref:HAD hydrolase-like protein n=1 Tax=Singulisphaera sp. GP187 TaxID=1882752 RepID=UPI00092891DD|nr:HAD hydrolase-like protein [Singulisphaera sp. GP187]SIO55140.1 phosphoglycolate phosphatase [Singulisphaera sp. GP187]